VLQVRLFDLPVDAAFLIAGFSRSSLALDAYGMPGCTAYPGLEAVRFTGGANHQAVAMLPIPNLAVLVGATFHLQALVPDPGAGNALGAVMSDAATAVIGR
jgi:hypothetical protein